MNARPFRTPALPSIQPISWQMLNEACRSSCRASTTIPRLGRPSTTLFFPDASANIFERQQKKNKQQPVWIYGLWPRPKTSKAIGNEQKKKERERDIYIYKRLYKLWGCPRCVRSGEGGREEGGAAWAVVTNWLTQGTKFTLI